MNQFPLVKLISIEPDLLGDWVGRFVLGNFCLFRAIVLLGYYINRLRSMAIRVVEFSNRGYKIRKIFA